ncbi:enoyl-CoA hydratase [Trichodelitschia bisporula]|uniref:Enoyl-CoA hydratase n=1 Tax=Trichodelitschia bisporula TaxID=703511 RepID=A0A6G1I0D8_9PEZI|nr:enoyl-CoA hydratase [Trichodelitschia bisporula]
MTPQPSPLSLPASYHDLPFTDIKLSHHPASSPEPTPIIILTLHRPGKHNAFTETMTLELESAFAHLSADPRVKCIIITGHGKIFCAGADLELGFPAHPGSPAEVANARDGGGRVSLAIHRCLKPTIAALNGSAVGVGITMTLPMSIRLAPRSAKIGFVFARRGLVMEAASSYFLPRLIGRSRTMHLVTTGAVYPAEHKLLEGLFSEVLDSPEEVMRRAVEIATEYVDNCSGVSWALMRDMVWRGPGSAEEAHLLDSRVIHDLFGSKDNEEGVRSFMEKRPVKFTGKLEEDAPAVYPWWTPVDVVPRAKGVLDDKAKL